MKTGNIILIAILVAGLGIAGYLYYRKEYPAVPGSTTANGGTPVPGMKLIDAKTAQIGAQTGTDTTTVGLVGSIGTPSTNTLLTQNGFTMWVKAFIVELATNGGSLAQAQTLYNQWWAIMCNKDSNVHNDIYSMHLLYLTAANKVAWQACSYIRANTQGSAVNARESAINNFYQNCRIAAGFPQTNFDPTPIVWGLPKGVTSKALLPAPSNTWGPEINSQITAVAEDGSTIIAPSANLIYFYRCARSMVWPAGVAPANDLNKIVSDAVAGVGAAVAVVGLV